MLRLKSDKIEDYLQAIGKLRPGDWIYECSSQGNKYSSLIKYQSHEVPKGENKYFTVSGQVTRLRSGGIRLSLNTLSTDTWNSIATESEIVTGTLEEVKPLFIADFKAIVAEEKKNIDQEAKIMLRKLEDAFK